MSCGWCLITLLLLYLFSIPEAGKNIRIATLDLESREKHGKHSHEELEEVEVSNRHMMARSNETDGQTNVACATQ